MVKRVGEHPQRINERTYEFALRTLRMVRMIEQRRGNRYDSTSILLNQLVRSATSIGANVEEAQAAESRKDFLHKIRIALKEARETHYWLKLLIEGGVLDTNSTNDLLDESDQLLRILSAIAASTQSRLK